MTLAYGVGFNDGKYPSSINNKQIKEHCLWLSMLQRCYNEKALKRRPTYVGCMVSENFKNYSYFYEWCQNQIGFGEDGFELEKDLLVKGNKIYSEDFCLFLPKKINSAIVTKKSCRGDLPIGVYFSKLIKRYVARCTVNGKTKHIGSFMNPIDAFLAYKPFKEEYLKGLANEFRHSIDARAYNALMNYKVDITD